MNTFRLAAVTVVVLIALTLSGPHAAAQGFGIKGGPIFTNFSSEALDFSNEVGTELGAFFDSNRAGTFAIQGEANWLRKKSEIDTSDLRIDYIQLAGLLRLNIGANRTSGFGIYGLVGPGFDFKIGESVEGLDLDDAFNSWDVGLLFGGGVEIRRFLIEGRWQQGLRQINSDVPGTTVEEVKSHGFSLLFGFRFK